MLGYEDYVFHSCHLYRWLPLLVTPGPQLQSPPKSKDLRRCPDQGLPMWSKCQRLPQDLGVSGSELWYMPPLSKEVLLVQMAGDAWLDGTSLVALEYTPLHDNRHCVCYVLSLNLRGLSQMDYTLCAGVGPSCVLLIQRQLLWEVMCWLKKKNCPILPRQNGRTISLSSTCGISESVSLCID